MDAESGGLTIVPKLCPEGRASNPCCSLSFVQAYCWYPSVVAMLVPYWADLAENLGTGTLKQCGHAVSYSVKSQLSAALPQSPQKLQDDLFQG